MMRAWRCGASQWVSVRVLGALIFGTFLLRICHSPSQERNWKDTAFGNISLELPGLCVVARTYTDSLHLAAVSLLSLASSSYPRLHLFLLRTDLRDVDPLPFAKVANGVNSLLGNPTASLMALN